MKKLLPNTKRIVTVIGFSAAVLALSVLIAALNITVTLNTGGREYSLDNVISHIAALSQKEHSIYDEEASDEVRNYISGVLYGCGIENETITHLPRTDYNEKTEEFTYYQPRNIYAEIAGESGTNILLVAHYDSCPYKIKYDEASEGSRGAIDDGYGVAVLLEAARVFSSASGLKNGIKLVFTDGEENGLLGSYALVEEYADWLSDVNLVINVEGRGEKGPVYLFQTSANNNRIIDFYKHAGCPYTFSVASAVYDMLPNDTDLSPFLESGYAGINLASLDSLKNYHNEKDVFETVNETTLERYCNTVLPLLDEYISNVGYSDMNYFRGTSDSLFFTLLPNVLVSYGSAVGWTFFALTVSLIAALVAVFAWKKKINIVKTLISLAVDLALLIVVCGVGFVVSLLSCAVCKVKWHFMFVIGVPADVGLLIAFAIVAAASVVALTLFKQKLGISRSEMTFGALIFGGIMSIVCACVLFGGSFLFVIPALLFALTECLSFVKNEKIRTPLAAAAVALSSVFALSLYISLVYSVYLSLTFGALGILLLLSAVPLLPSVPCCMGVFDGSAQAAKPLKTENAEVTL